MSEELSFDEFVFQYYEHSASPQSAWIKMESDLEHGHVPDLHLQKLTAYLRKVKDKIDDAMIKLFFNDN